MQALETPVVEPAPVYVLETERLLLRIPSPTDNPYEEKMCMDDRFQFMWQYKRPDRCAIILNLVLEIWLKHGVGALSIEDKDTGEYLGRIYLNRRPINPGEAEGWFLGYGLAPSAEGRGIAYEAAKAACDWYMSTGKVSEILFDRLPKNDRSRALLERLGCVFSGDYTEHDYFGQLELWRFDKA